MRDIIFLSLENWDEVWRRNQFVCSEMARRFPDQRILFVGKPLFVPLLAKWSSSVAGRVQVRQELRRRFWRVPQSNIWVFNPIKLVPNPIPGGRAFNESAQISQVRRAAERAGIRDPLLWINPYDSGFFIGHLGERGVVYDITDDWELMATPPAFQQLIKTQDRDLCRRADLTIVCSPALYQSRKDLTQEILLLPNGVNADHYAGIQSTRLQPPGHFDAQGGFHPRPDPNGAPELNGHAQTEASNAAPGDNANGVAVNGVASNGGEIEVRDANEVGANGRSGNGQGAAGNLTEERAQHNGEALKTWPRPVFGYTGSLHNKRVDLELVVQLARAHPGGSVVLVGPQHWTDDSLQKALKSTPNLYAPGAAPYSRIPEVMARFDVCIVPHHQSEFVESLNPIKLWEYLAAGKPIVSTDVAGFRDYPELVRLARDPRSFIEACRQALAEVNGCIAAAQSQNGVRNGVSNGAAKWPQSPSLSAARRAAVAQESWAARVDALLACLLACDLISPADLHAASNAGSDSETSAETTASGAEVA